MYITQDFQEKINTILQKNNEAYKQILQKNLSDAYNVGYHQANELSKTIEEQVITNHIINNEINTKGFIDTLKTHYTKLKNKLKKPTILQPSKQKPRGKILFETHIKEETIKYLEKTVFHGSENTIKRIGERLFKIIKETSEIKGKGINEVAKEIQKEYTQLSKTEAKRIARTEANKAKETANYSQLLNDETIEYVQWITADDDRVRESHEEQNGMITRIGNTFPNGCIYPSDPNAEPSESINCRCTLVAYYFNVNETAPVGIDCFFEDDIVTIENNTNNDTYDNIVSMILQK